MGKQNMVYPYNGILFNFKKEGTVYDINDLEDVILSEISQLRKYK
jgi:hypothetical protein